MVLLTASERGNKVKCVKIKLVTSFSLSVLCLMVAVMLMIVDPVFFITKLRMRVKEGGIVHDILKKPVAIYNAVHLFNITNAEEFLSGEHDKIRVEEVGPFTYKELRINKDLELDLEAGEIRYELTSEVSFVPEQSIADPAEVNVTMLNLPLLGLTSTISTYSYWTQMAFSMLTSQLKSKPIVKMNARQYLWGYEDPLITLANTAVPGLVNFNKMGILDRLYDKKAQNKLVVGTGDDSYMIKTRNGYKKLGMGDSINPEKCAKCDDFTNAYDGILYPCGVTEKTPINLFRQGLCRILNMVYNRTVSLEYGAVGLVYNLSDSFYSMDPNVTKNRVLDLTDCFYGLPIGLTKVGFLGMDPEVYERIEGIKQDPTKESYIIVEPIIGMEMETYFPVQLNLLLKNTKYIPATRAFSDMMIPIGYVEIIQPKLPPDTYEALKMIYVIGPLINLVSKILLIVASVVLFTYTVLVYFGVNKKIVFFPPARKSKANNVLSVREPLMTAKPNTPISY